MNETYNPSKGEVTVEVVKDISKDAINFGYGLTESVFTTLKVTLAISAAPYFTSSFIRSAKSRELFTKKIQPSAPLFLGYSAGIFAGVTSLFLQVNEYNKIINEHPEILAVPVATNLASLALEGVRNKAKTAREKLIEQHSVRSLDKVVKESQEDK